jgi:hypothetical protein
VGRLPGCPFRGVGRRRRCLTPPRAASAVHARVRPALRSMRRGRPQRAGRRPAPQPRLNAVEARTGRIRSGYRRPSARKAPSRGTTPLRTGSSGGPEPVSGLQRSQARCRTSGPSATAVRRAGLTADGPGVSVFWTVVYETHAMLVGVFDARGPAADRYGVREPSPRPVQSATNGLTGTERRGEKRPGFGGQGQKTGR